MISAFADNVFAVGRVGAAASERYIKHMRPGSAAHVFGAAHVPWFRIRKRANFTFFEFRGFAREGALRLSDGDRREWQLIDRIAELKRLGMPVRTIAKTLEMSTTTVQRYAVMYKEETAPVPHEPKELPPDETDEFYDEMDGFETNGQDDGFEEDLSNYWFKRGFEQMHSNADPDAHEDPEYEFLTETDDREAPVEFFHEKAADRQKLNGFDRENAADHQAGDGFDGGQRAGRETADEYLREISAGCEESGADADPKPLLERDVDNYGRELWVEKRDERGRRLVWYQALTNNGRPIGKYTRWEHRGLAGNIGHTVDHLPTRESGRAPQGY